MRFNQLIKKAKFKYFIMSIIRLTKVLCFIFYEFLRLCSEQNIFIFNIENETIQIDRCTLLENRFCIKCL